MHRVEGPGLEPGFLAFFQQPLLLDGHHAHLLAHQPAAQVGQRGREGGRLAQGHAEGGDADDRVAGARHVGNGAQVGRQVGFLPVLLGKHAVFGERDQHGIRRQFFPQPGHGGFEAGPVGVGLAKFQLEAFAQFLQVGLEEGAAAVGQEVLPFGVDHMGMPRCRARARHSAMTAALSTPLS